MAGRLRISFPALLGLALAASAQDGARARGSATSLPSDDPLAVARKFEGTPYGTGEGEFNCVTLLVRILGEMRSLDDGTRRRILIDNIGRHESLDDLVARGDERTRGVQYALESAGLGKAIPLTEARPGDLVQYWYRKKDGHWAGHASVIERVRGDGVVDIYGAHLKTAKVTTLRGIRLKGDDRRAYVVRLLPPRRS